MQNLTALVSVDALSRIVGAASTEKTRPHLQGVNVSKRRKTDGVLLCATDGHMLALENDERGETNVTSESHAIISRDAIAEIVRVAKLAHKKQFNEKTLLVLVTAESFMFGWSVEHGNAYGPPYPFKSCFVDGTFPDFERVIPRFDDDAVSTLKDTSFNAKQILQLAETAKTVRNGSALVVKMWQHDGGSPAVVRVAGAPHWLGVLMPFWFSAADNNRIHPSSGEIDESCNMPLPQWLR